MATYWLKNHLLTPRNGRRKLRKLVHRPSIVLSWTSRTPSPSSSRAHSRWPGVWQTVACVRPVAGRWLYACHSSVLTVASGRVWLSTTGSKVARSLCRQTCRRIWSLVRPTTPAIGTRSVSQLPCPRALFARRRGGSRGSACLRPFSPAFWYSSSASVTSSGSGSEGGKALGEQGLDLVPALQQMGAVNPQLCRQVFGGHTLGNAAQDLDNGRTAIARLGPDGAGKHIEDGATGATAIVQDRGAVPSMGRLIERQRMPLGTVQPVRMQDAEQEGIARLLIQQLIERKLQHWLPSIHAWFFTSCAAQMMPMLPCTSDP